MNYYGNRPNIAKRPEVKIGYARIGREKMPRIRNSPGRSLLAATWAAEANGRAPGATLSFTNRCNAFSGDRRNSFARSHRAVSASGPPLGNLVAR